jgi:hypothetical protein
MIFSFGLVTHALRKKKKKKSFPSSKSLGIGFWREKNDYELLVGNFW